ncbi:hypothetical protein, partial [Salmonella enterica]|uniref:hypothetical protein n=1 Tax=Salmonella enterica TaxID=28901 RepID=UPI000A5CF42B
TKLEDAENRICELEQEKTKLKDTIDNMQSKHEQKIASLQEEFEQQKVKLYEQWFQNVKAVLQCENMQ